MDDALLVRRALDGDLDSFGQLFDRYFNRIYDFVWRVLRDDVVASEVTQDVFTRAISGLRAAAKAPAFDVWLLTLAHHAAIDRASGLRRGPPGALHEEAFGSFEAPDPCRVDDPALATPDPDLPCLVWEGATSFGARDYALLDLAVRQRISSANLAPIAEVSRGQATALVSKLKQTAQGVLTTYIVGRRGTRECDDLRRVIGAREMNPMTDELRRDIDLHVAECPTCRTTRNLAVAPLEIFAALVPVQAPFVLKGELWRKLIGWWPEEGAPAATAATAVPLEPAPVRQAAATSFASAAALPLGTAGGGYDGARSGGIFAGSDDGSRNNLVWFIAAGVGMLVVAFIVGFAALHVFGGGSNGSAVGAGRTTTATPSARTTLTPGVSLPSVTQTRIAPTSTETEIATETPPPPPPDTPTPPPPPPPATNTPAPPAPTPTRVIATRTLTGPPRR